MKSTGEVMGIGPNFGEAYAKAQKGANKILRRSGVVFIVLKNLIKNTWMNLYHLLLNVVSR